MGWTLVEDWMMINGHPQPHQTATWSWGKTRVREREELHRGQQNHVFARLGGIISLVYMMEQILLSLGKSKGLIRGKHYPLPATTTTSLCLTESQVCVPASESSHFSKWVLGSPYYCSCNTESLGPSTIYTGHGMSKRHCLLQTHLAPDPATL